jgi:hypothetical protein
VLIFAALVFGLVLGYCAGRTHGAIEAFVDFSALATSVRERSQGPVRNLTPPPMTPTKANLSSSSSARGFVDDSIHPRDCACTWCR